MRVAALLILTAFFQAPETPPINIGKVHQDAENEIAADKKYGNKLLNYRVEVLKVVKVKDSYVLIGVGGSDTRGNDFPGSEFKIKQGAETPFADLRRNQEVTVRARYTGVSRRPGAPLDYVVTLDDAEVIQGPKKHK